MKTVVTLTSSEYRRILALC